MHTRFFRRASAPLLSCVALAASATAQPATAPTADGPSLTLQQGDRIVLIGNTLAERQQYFNNFETTLLVKQAALGLTVRNLGWSADTLTLQPRPLNFGDAPMHLTRQKADVILAFFGANESFEGEAGVPTFEKDLEAYVTAHRAAKYNGTSAPRLVLVSPIAHEKLPNLVHVDVDGRNRELARYTDAMRRVAAKVGVPFVDVFTPTREAMAQATAPLTVNGMHLNEDGDRIFADILMAKLGLATGPPMTRGKAYATLKAVIEEKNRLFFLRFRPLNAEYVVGRRLEPFGSVNFPPEMKQLDEMIAAQDKRIARDARALGKPTAAGPRKPAGATRPATSPAEGV
ncbi:MAG TPA: SGNH/GDSL hydrolase family protein [Luteitalea sp.]|nr:SGNH/GDSL hydrolase family protein [Luteitalea sp.]